MRNTIRMSYLLIGILVSMGSITVKSVKCPSLYKCSSPTGSNLSECLQNCKGGSESSYESMCKKACGYIFNNVQGKGVTSLPQKSCKPFYLASNAGNDDICQQNCKNAGCETPSKGGWTRCGLWCNPFSSD